MLSLITAEHSGVTLIYSTDRTISDLPQKDNAAPHENAAVSSHSENQESTAASQRTTEELHAGGPQHLQEVLL